MKKRLMTAMICLMAAVFIFGTGVAEIYLNQEAPADWADKETAVLTVFQQYGNDTALLEVGGKAILIDGGVKGARPQMEEALKGLGYDGHIDIFYNTHPHEDHVGAVQYMVREGFTADLFMSTFPEDYNHRDSIQKLAVTTLKEHGIPYRQIENGETMEFGEAKLTFWYYPEGKDPNASSSLMRMTFGNCTLLMTADVPKISQQWFHENLGPEVLRADIMKFPHHGITVAEKEFLIDVDPQFVYVTNYSRATPAVNEQLRQMGIPYMHTSKGRMVIRTDGEDWYIMQYTGMY